MTFILGMRCSDGLVMCADTLESDGVTKRYRQKLVPVNVGNEWGVMWGGSGTATVVDKFTDKFKQLVGNDSFNRSHLEIHAEATLQFIREQYIRPSDQISISMAIFGRPLLSDNSGSKFLGAPEFHLYRGYSESACISEEKDYCAIGMDVTLAECLLENMHYRFMKVVEGIRLGVFVTSAMKRYAEGVGGETSCFSYFYGDTDWKPIFPQEIKQIESDFQVSDFNEHIHKFWASKGGVTFAEFDLQEMELKKRQRQFDPSSLPNNAID